MKHPGKTVAQRRVLDHIGCGDYLPSATRETLDRMVGLGLLTRLQDRVLGRDGFGTIAVPQYEMPLPVHYQWCSYWAEQPCEDDAA